MRVRRHTRAPRDEPRWEPETEPEAELAREPEPAGSRGAHRVRLAAALIGGLAAVFGAGYLASVLLFSPGPLVTQDHSIPRVLELGATAARERLTRAGFRVRVDGSRPNPEFPRNAVVWQDPAEGTIAPEGTQVTLLLSSGPSAVPVPDLDGMAVPQARIILEAGGLKLGAVDSVLGGREAGIVVTTRPGVGTLRDPGTTVDLVVSTGQRGAFR